MASKDGRQVCSGPNDLGDPSAGNSAVGQGNDLSAATNSFALGLCNTVSGDKNSAFGSNQSILGNSGNIFAVGDSNTIADGYFQTVVLGLNNYVASSNSLVSGVRNHLSLPECVVQGYNNYVAGSAGLAANVCGGSSDSLYDASNSAILSGARNSIDTASTCAIVTGSDNEIHQAHFSSIGGGERNVIDNAGVWPSPIYSATLAGGTDNYCGNSWATLSGGQGNSVSGGSATVGGGSLNSASGVQSTIAGGGENAASAQWSTVGGGVFDTASGQGATVPGGYENVAEGNYSFAAGREAKARHDGTYVWADQSGGDFVSTAANQYLIRANGNVGINTNSPSQPLTVAGTVYSTSGGFKFPDGTVQTTAYTGGALSSDYGLLDRIQHLEEENADLLERLSETERQYAELLSRITKLRAMIETQPTTTSSR